MSNPIGEDQVVPAQLVYDTEEIGVAADVTAEIIARRFESYWLLQLALRRGVGELATIRCGPFTSRLVSTRATIPANLVVHLLDGCDDIVGILKLDGQTLEAELAPDDPPDDASQVALDPSLDPTAIIYSKAAREAALEQYT